MHDHTPEGIGVSSVAVANSILRKAFESSVPASLMKPQRLLFFTTMLYSRRTGFRLWSMGLHTGLCTIGSFRSAYCQSADSALSPLPTCPRWMPWKLVMA